MKLIATKAYSYNTRRLRAGDEFEANDYHARVLVGARKARYAPDAAVEPPPPVERVVEAEDYGAKSIEQLRAQAEQLGITVDGRWGVNRLQQEIMQAKR